MSEDWEDETDVSEITIQPDGRVYVFGASRQVLDLLMRLDPRDLRIPQLLSRGRREEEEEAVSVRQSVGRLNC